MSRYLTLLLLIVLSVTRLNAKDNFTERDYELFDFVDTTDFSQSLDFFVLAEKLSSHANNDREKLVVLYFWLYKYMTFDVEKFKVGGEPLQLNDILHKKKGLCTEYTTIISNYCKYCNIECLEIDGYVAFNNQKNNSYFQIPNHNWNAVKIKGKWMFFDGLWSCGAVSFKNNISFIPKLNTEYFLAPPELFIKTHLPKIPAWQLLDYPISMKMFLKATREKDIYFENNKYFNYEDTLKKYGKYNIDKRKIEIAKDAYQFNKYNPNDLIIACYNTSVSSLNKTNLSISELKQIKKNLELGYKCFNENYDPSLNELKSEYERVINFINNKIN